MTEGAQHSADQWMAKVAQVVVGGAGLGGIFVVAGVGALYGLYSGAAALNQRLSQISEEREIDGYRVRREILPPPNGGWRFAKFVQPYGLAIITVTNPDGSLEAKIRDSGVDNQLNKDEEYVEVPEAYTTIGGQTITSVITYFLDRAEERSLRTNGQSTSKTHEFNAKPELSTEARNLDYLLQRSKEVRGQWQAFLQKTFPNIKAQTYRQQRRMFGMRT